MARLDRTDGTEVITRRAMLMMIDAGWMIQ